MSVETVVGRGAAPASNGPGGPAKAFAPLGAELDALRRRYSDEALANIPKLLILVDRNPLSPTYGCFDRAYWHYRTMDFPCGMAQEMCLPLALANANPFPDNPFYGVARVRELALAGVDFARRSSLPNGSCDDYFPFEQALGATTFSLYGCAETCIILGDRRPESLEFLARRGDWLLHHNESGRLTNHQAFAALALHCVWELTGEKRFAEGRDKYLDIVDSWGTPEGWFYEYEGADPGYHSCTVAFLGKLLVKAKDEALRARIVKTLEPAVEFAWHFMHPDGSYAGEYGSRNTYHFFPHGFEVMAACSEIVGVKAAQIADQFLRLGLPNRTRYYNDDDRMCAHYLYDWFQAFLDFHPARPEPLNTRPNFIKVFPKAGMVVRKTDTYYAVVNLSKGGVLKILDERGPFAGDTGLIGRTEDGRVLVSHLVDERNRVEIGEEIDGRIDLKVSGAMFARKTKLPTPFKQILFRVLNLTFGRFNPNLLRTILQKILITGKPRTDATYARKITLGPDAIEIEDTISRPEGGARFASLSAGSDATSIYVANSNVYQKSVLLPWVDLSGALGDLNAKGSATIKRVFRSTDDRPWGAGGEGSAE